MFRNLPVCIKVMNIAEHITLLVKLLKINIAALEGGKYGLAFASGCAATTTIAHLLKKGDHMICSDDVYGGTFRLFDKVIQIMELNLVL